MCQLLTGIFLGIAISAAIIYDLLRYDQYSFVLLYNNTNAIYRCTAQGCCWTNNDPISMLKNYILLINRDSRTNAAENATFSHEMMADRFGMVFLRFSTPQCVGALAACITYTVVILLLARLRGHRFNIFNPVVFFVVSGTMAFVCAGIRETMSFANDYLYP